MKILHVYKDYYPVIGGIENYVKNLAEYQVKHGLDVTVLVTSTSGRTTFETINSVRVIKASRINKISSTPICLSLFKWIRSLKTDITHLHFPYPVGEVANYFLGQSRHTMITYHSYIIKQRYMLSLYRPLLIKVLGKADRIIATSPAYIETSPFLRKVKSKCTVIPLGADISRFVMPDIAKVKWIWEKYGVGRILLFVGRLRYFKGLSYLIEAVKEVDARLLIIGTGPEEKILKEKVAREEWMVRLSSSEMSRIMNFLHIIMPATFSSCRLPTGVRRSALS